MVFIGIDVSSEKHDCCIVSESRKVLKQFTFLNSSDGFKNFLEASLSLAAPEETKIGLEATGVYGNNLVSFLRNNGFEVVTFNPLSVKKRLNANTLRKTKTDKADAKFLALLLTQDNFKPDVEISYHISELKSLSRARLQLVEECSKYKTRAKALLTELFPEFNRLFSHSFCNTELAILASYPSAKDLASARARKLAAIIDSSSNGHYRSNFTEEVIELARHSIGTYSETKAMQLQFCIRQIEIISEYIHKYDTSIKSIMKEINSPILTIPGISFTLGAMILGEIGDISRFSSPAKVLAFAGLEPSVYQSGKYSAASGSMVKRGSRYLRWAIGQASRIVPKFDEIFGAYLEKKRSEGKHYNVACSHVAKKLVRVIYGILKNNTEYSSTYSPVAA